MTDRPGYCSAGSGNAEIVMVSQEPMHAVQIIIFFRPLAVQ